MVRITLPLLRKALIKFPKGGLSQASEPAAAAAPPPPPKSSMSLGGCPMPMKRARVQAEVSMSTCSIPDIELPPRYRRIPLSQEEIDKINGGGIV